MTNPRPADPTGVFETRGLSVGYDRGDVFTDLDLRIEPGEITTLIGANGCGKSTLVRTLGRLLKPRAGHVLLNGRRLDSISTRRIAQRVAVLPQSPITPPATTVRELVSRGRFPHRHVWQGWTAEDDRQVTAALAATGMTDLADRDVDQLSGGQRQRAWIALVIAQGTDTILLDEPTTFLDLRHQLDVLRLIRRVNAENGTTVVMVLHDLNLAARYSDRLIALTDGVVVADGRPWDVITSDVLQRAFGLSAGVIADPHTGTPMIVPTEESESADETVRLSA